MTAPATRLRIVVAVGGNALQLRGETIGENAQRERLRDAVRALGPLLEHELVICHGNGPQVGMLALETEDDSSLAEPFRLDTLVAETQGMIGYWICQAVRNATGAEVLGVVTQTVVDEADPAFGRPTKFIGRTYDDTQAARLQSRPGWTLRRDGAAWRRVVASPQPVRIVETPVIADLLDRGVLVVAGGGGGVPVVDRDGQLDGVAAIVDKDNTAARLAVDVHADVLAILTDVPGVVAGYGTSDEHLLTHLDADDIASLNLPDGSMGPKVEACRWFATTTGRLAVIGALGDAGEVLAGRAGTLVTSSRGARR